jgi:hypothetical protein
MSNSIGDLFKLGKNLAFVLFSISSVKLVEHSLYNHPVSNIWDKHKKSQTRRLRYTGTLGEVVFADLYDLPRPVRSFGALDGQDFGKDFSMSIEGVMHNFDIKTMKRKSHVFYKNYVLNIPARNVHRKDSITDYYFCINIHEKSDDTIASMIGYIYKKDIIEGRIGILYKAGTRRTRADQTSFTFFEDTYEVLFSQIKTPLLTSRIRKKAGFQLFKLK